MPAEDSISGSVLAAVGDFSAELWLIVPAALAIGVGLIWGVPKAKAFFKKVAS